MRKKGICICENKDTDQLSGNCEVDQCLCFRYTDSTIPLLLKSGAIFSGCTVWFVSDLVGNPEDWHVKKKEQISCVTVQADQRFCFLQPI